jgi:FKBP-type peptidyl-prolyl cis-trans isomerase
MSKNEKIAVFISVALAFVFYTYFGNISGSGSLGPSVDAENVKGIEEVGKVSLEDGINVEDLVVGKGDRALNGTLLTVHYVGMLADGTEFDSSYKRGQPFQFFLGQGDLIKGWDIGIIGMREGGIRRLTISPEFGYGPIQAGPIPPNSTLVFEVELLEVSTQ